MRVLANLFHFIRSTQIYVVSYPKTGRTWLRTMIGKYLIEHYGLPETEMMKTDRLTLGAGLSKTKFTHDGAALSRRIPYTELNPSKASYREKKVLLLTRNVKDTVVSAYFQATRRRGLFDGPITTFVRDEFFGVRKILTFYKQWYENREVPDDLILLKYEDIHQNPARALETSLNFIGLQDVRMDLIRSTVEYSSFENLRKLERQRIRNSGQLDDPEAYKARQGKVGNFNQYLDDDDIAFIDESISTWGCEFIY